MDKQENLTFMQGIIIIFLVGAMGFVAYVFSYGLQNVADEKAKNPKNLIEGCMYYVKNSYDKYHRDILIVNIDNRQYRDIDIYPHSTLGFPQSYKDFIVKNKEMCHKIGYIHFDFIIFDRLYVYHL